jgi:hypothetical protein
MKKPTTVVVKYYKVWIEPDEVDAECDYCGDLLVLRQLNIMSYCSVLGKPMHISYRLARLCQACGSALDDEPPF